MMTRRTRFARPAFVLANLWLLSVTLGCAEITAAPITRGPSASSPRRVDGPFGMHGPTYSHLLQARDPNVWRRGDALLRVFVDAGPTWARQDFWWSLCEPEKGRFRWDDFDRAVEAYHRRGINLFVILCYASAWSGGVSPATDEERERFGQYVYAMVRRYKDKVGAWEVWNEPNIQPFWSPRPSPELYAELLKVAYKAAKRADPDCVVVGGALAGPDAAFLAGMYEHGAAGHFDVLSYHNYGQRLCLESEWPEVEKIRAVMARHGDGAKPIWHTETGFFTGPVGIPEEEQGSWIVRFSVGLLALGVDKTFQLTLHDWTDDPQHHDLSVYRGITHADFRLKPSYAAYRTMCQRLNDKRLVGSIRPARGISGFLFEGDDGERVLVLWRDDRGSAAPVPIDLDVPLVLIQHMAGDWQRLRSPDGRYELPVGADPVYVFDPGPAILNQSWVCWPNPVLTKVPRSAAATVEVEVTNPTAAPAEFACGIDETDPLRVAGRAWRIGPKSRATIAVKVDTSTAAVGEHELAWVLRGPGGRDGAAGAPGGGGRGGGGAGGGRGGGDGAAGPPLAAGFRRMVVESPLRLGFGAVNRLDAAAPRLPAVVDYHGAEPTDGTLSLRLNDEPVAGGVSVTLEPGQPRTALLPFELGPFASGEPVAIRLRLESVGLTLTTECRRPLIPCPAAPGDAKVDGDLCEWTSRPPQITPAMLSWEYVNARETPDPDDLAATGWVAYDDRGLWVAVRVRDDRVDLPRTRAVWNWDSLQVALDMGGDGRPEARYDGNDYEIELGAGEGGAPWCYLGYCPVGWPEEELTAKLVGAVNADRATGTVAYELLIPASLMVSSTALERGTVMGFSILVNDSDGSGRAGWQELTPGIGLGKQPWKFAWLWLR